MLNYQRVFPAVIIDFAFHPFRDTFCWRNLPLLEVLYWWSCQPVPQVRQGLGVDPAIHLVIWFIYVYLPLHLHRTTSMQPLVCKMTVELYIYILYIYVCVWMLHGEIAHHWKIDLSHPIPLYWFHRCPVIFAHLGWDLSSFQRLRTCFSPSTTSPLSTPPTKQNSRRFLEQGAFF